MITQEVPITIYSEMTPNPNTMKFVANKMLVEEDVVAEYLNKHFTGLLDMVISKDCETIQFYID